MKSSILKFYQKYFIQCALFLMFLWLLASLLHIVELLVALLEFERPEHMLLIMALKGIGLTLIAGSLFVVTARCLCYQINSLSIILVALLGIYFAWITIHYESTVYWFYSLFNSIGIIGLAIIFLFNILFWIIPSSIYRPR